MGQARKAAAYSRDRFWACRSTKFAPLNGRVIPAIGVFGIPAFQTRSTRSALG
jgi:hypothetical protein